MLYRPSYMLPFLFLVNQIRRLERPSGGEHGLMKTEFLLLGAAGIAESRLKAKREGVTAHVATLEFRLLGHQKG